MASSSSGSHVLVKWTSCPRLLTKVLCGVLFIGAACKPSGWRSELFANPNLVARALNDPLELGPAEPFDKTMVPDIAPPKHVRPCCAFGMDLQVKLGPTPVPFYEKSNIIGLKELAPHGYDDGNFVNDKNGLLYTCRGGFIDSAHVRDNADLTLYLTMAILKALPQGVTISLPDEGTRRRLVIKPISEALVRGQNRWHTAIAIAEWAAFTFSVWHEIITWYGWESVPGFSERLSAFSPEDLYSNVLGLRIAGGIIGNRESRSREMYDQAMDAWMREALVRLYVVSRDDARLAMQAVDGLWWDSRRAIPEFKLVLRRSLNITSPLSPWLVLPTLQKRGMAQAELSKMCSNELPRLLLEVPEQLAGEPISEVATVEFEFSDWIPQQFPFPVTKGSVLTQADFQTILKDIRRDGAEELGGGFYHP